MRNGHGALMAGDGSNFDFPAEEFRDAIHTAMVMGSPNQIPAKATFRWDPVRTYAPQDPAHRPYHWNQVPISDLTQPDVVLDEVAVEYTAARRDVGTAVGEFVPMRGQLTMLDVDYARVVGANWVLLNTVPWAITAQTVGALFSVDVHTLFLERQ